MIHKEERIGRPKVWRSSERSVTVAFPRRWLGHGVDTYKWSAASAWYPRCDDRFDCAAFYDKAPDHRALTAE